MSNNKNSEKSLPAIPEKEYVLTRDVSINGKIQKLGSKVKLNDPAAEVYRKKNRIK